MRGAKNVAVDQTLVPLLLSVTMLWSRWFLMSSIYLASLL